MNDSQRIEFYEKSIKAIAENLGINTYNVSINDLLVYINSKIDYIKKNNKVSQVGGDNA
jgi:transcriptional regulatory protein LevR